MFSHGLRRGNSHGQVSVLSVTRLDRGAGAHIQHLCAWSRVIAASSHGQTHVSLLHLHKGRHVCYCIFTRAKTRWIFTQVDTHVSVATSHGRTRVLLSYLHTSRYACYCIFTWTKMCVIRSSHGWTRVLLSQRHWAEIASQHWFGIFHRISRCYCTCDTQWFALRLGWRLTRCVWLYSTFQRQPSWKVQEKKNWKEHQKLPIGNSGEHFSCPWTPL